MTERTVTIALRSRVAAFNQGLRQAGAEVERTGKKVEGFAQRNSAAMTKAGMAAVAFGGAAAFALNKAANASNELNAEMANIATLIPNQTARVYELRDSVQELAVDVGKSTSDISGGLYQVVSAFGDTADTADILRINAEGARAGLASTTDAINLTSAVTKGYGDTTSEAVQHAMDLAFTTVRLGQTDFPQLAASIGSVVPLASALNVTQEELFGTMATFTGVTGNAAEVSTQLTSVLTAMMNPSKELAGLMEQLGFASGEAMLEGLGLQGTIQAIADEADSSGTPIMAFLRRKEAVTLALAASGGQADVFAEKLGEMSDASGAAEIALAEMTEGIGRWQFNAEQAAVQQEVAMQKLGESVAPVKAAFTGFIGDTAQAFSDLSPEMQKATAIAGMAASGLGLVGGAALILVPRVVAFKAAVAASGVSLDGVRLRAMYAAPALLKLLPVLAAVGVAWQQHAARARDVESASASLVAQLDQEGAAVAEVTAEWVRGEVVRRNLAGDLRDAGIPVELLTSALMGNAEALSTVDARLRENVTGWDRVRNAVLPTSLFPQLAAGSSQLSAELRILNDAAVGAAASSDYLGSSVDETTYAATQLTPAAGRAAAVTDDMRAAAAAAGVDIDELADSTEQAESAFDDLTPSIEAAFTTLAQGFDPMRQYQDNLAELNEANRKAAEGTDRTTTDMAASWSAYMTALDQTLTDQRAWHANLNTIREASSDWYADHLAAQGPENAALHAEIAKQEASEIQAGADKAQAIRDEAIQEGVDRLLRSEPQWVDAAGEVSAATVAEIAEKLNTTEDVVRTAIGNSIPALEAQFRAMAAAAGTGAESTVAAMAFELGKGTEEAGKIVNAWANATGQNLNPLLMAVGKDEIPMFARKLLAGAGIGGSMGTPRADGGFGLLPQEALIQTPQGPGGLIQWAEPETHGEAFIPLAPGKRPRSLQIWEETGRLLGVDMKPTPFGIGGFNVPPTPSFDPLGFPLSTTGERVIDATREAIEEFVGELQTAHAPGVPGSLAPPGGGSTIQRLIQMASAVPHRVTSTYRPNSKTYHGMGRAVDFADPAGRRPRGSPAMMAIFNQLLRYAANLKELFYTPAGFCVPHDTLILTRRGWLRHDEVEVGDETVGYNPKTGCNEWTAVEEVLHFDAEPLIEVRSKAFKFRCTAAHRWATERRARKDGQRQPVEETTEAASLTSEHKIIATAPLDDAQKSPLSPQEAAIVGWLITDGYVSRRYPTGAVVSATIWQSEKKAPQIARLRELLSDVPHSVGRRKRDDCVSFRLRSRWVEELLLRAGDDLESLVLNLSTEARRSMFDAMFDAEGTTSKKTGQRLWSQNEGPVLEAFVLLAYLLGERPSRYHTKPVHPDRRPHQVVSLCKPRVGGVGTGLHQKPAGIEPVWCVRTALGTWTAQQNGVVTVTGNSIKNGQRTRPIAASTHWDHVHAAMREGGILRSYDQGGLLRPGMTLASNETGGNEIIAAQGMIQREIEHALQGIHGIEALRIALAVEGVGGDLGARSATDAIALIERLTDAWETAQRQAREAEERSRLAAEVEEARAAFESADAEDRVRLHDEWAQSIRRLEAADRSRREGEAQRRIQAELARLETERQIAANREAWEFDKLSTADQLMLIEQKLAAERRYTDEWMRLARQRQQLAEELQRAATARVDDLNRLLDERQALLDRMADAEARHASQVQDAHARHADAMRAAQERANSAREAAARQLADRLAQIERQAADERQRIIESREQALVAFFSPESRLVRTFANSIGSVTRNVEDQLAAFNQWSEGLDNLRSMGLSEEAIAAMGLETPTAQSLATVQGWASATEDEISAANEAFAAMNHAAATQAGDEAARMLGAVGDALTETARRAAEETARVQSDHSERLAAINAEFHDATARAREELNDRLADLDDDLQAQLGEMTDALGQIGLDQGRTYSEAIAEGIASGLPGILAAVQAAQDAMAGAGTVTPGPNMSAGELRAYARQIGWDDDLSVLAQRIRTQGFDRGGWLPPHSTTLAVNNTPRWEPVGAGTHMAGGQQIEITIDARGAEPGVEHRIRAAVQDALNQTAAKVKQKVG